MIDFHSHVLPGIDDGARSVKESIALLRMLREQGIEGVAATPHFYAYSNVPDRFFENREAAFRCLTAALPKDEPFPRLKLGAEVLYYPGISRMKQLKSFCLEGTRLLLLEMPFSRWDETTVREVLEMHRTRGVTVMLAHIERYLAMQKKDVWRLFLENGLLRQVNADFFLSLRTRGKAVKMFERGEITFIGSDCHNPLHRPPYMDGARAYLLKKAGISALSAFERQGQLFWEGRE